MDPSSTAAPPKLQVAHILADLNTLKQAQPKAALSFLRTLSTIPPTAHDRKTSIHPQPPATFDRLGRRIPSPQSASQFSSTSPSPSPPLRKHSSMESIDLPETEESIREGQERLLERRRSSEKDQEFMRAKTLLTYYINRDKLVEKGERGWKASQERVNKALNEHAERRHTVKKRASGERIGVPGVASYF